MILKGNVNEEKDFKINKFGKSMDISKDKDNVGARLSMRSGKMGFESKCLVPTICFKTNRVTYEWFLIQVMAAATPTLKKLNNSEGEAVLLASAPATGFYPHPPTPADCSVNSHVTNGISNAVDYLVEIQKQNDIAQQKCESKTNLKADVICDSESMAGNGNLACPLTVVYPRNKLIRTVGDSLTLNCTVKFCADQAQEPVVHWCMLEAGSCQPVPPNRTNSNHDKESSIFVSYTIAYLNFSDSGIFRCEALQGIMKAIGNSIVLNVTEAPDVPVIPVEHADNTYNWYYLVLLPLFVVIVCVILYCRDFTNADAECCWMQLKMPGDYIIGGLFQIHVESNQNHSKPKVPTCKRFSDDGYIHFQTMRFAIEEINNSSSLLPNVTLGYEIFDDCEISIDIQGAFAFVSRPPEYAVEIAQFEYKYQHLATAVIGPLESDAAIITASILSLFGVPQISFGASSEELSDKTQYPTFMRTIPNDENQIEAIILLIQKFQWNWISVIGSSNAYGENGKFKMKSSATALGICVASESTIPQQPSESKQEIIDIIDNIIVNRVNVVVVISNVQEAGHFFRVVVAMNITGKVWILSEAISVKRIISEIPNIKRIGTVLGVAAMQGKMPGYKEFVLRDILAWNPGFNQRVKYTDPQGKRQECPDDSLMAACNQCVPCTSDGVRSLLQLAEWRVEFNVYSAVYAAAQGLHQLLQCNSGECKKEAAYPRQLLKTLKRVNFSLNGMPISFDENGNPPIGYDIIYWDWKNDIVSFNVIGSYNPGQLQIDGSLIDWNSQGGKIPTSNCSSECEPGQIKITLGFQPCCFTCKDCVEGTFQNESECVPCDLNHWSPSKSTVCLNRHVVYLRWNESFSIVIASVTGIGLIVKVLISTIFAIYFDTPVVKAAGGKLSFVLLLALAISCSSVYFFIAEPNVGTCITRKLLSMVSYTTCLACLLVRSFQLVLIFKMASKLPMAYRYWVQYNGQYIFVFMTTVIEIALCFIWIFSKFPVFHRDYDISKTEVILICGSKNSLSSLPSVGGITFLSLLCFVFAFLGKNLPKQYNEAKYITFSMTMIFISWIFLFLVIPYCPMNYAPGIQAAVLLLNCYSITVGYFFPKCYIILLKPECNTTAFFQTRIHEYTRNRETPQP
ncbi:taste receptor type 1 member 1-like [Carcharodon carcharias]|uniref:taste receptor type 1 member 1-like n=1 Tax=Carcharodon carcharias TaxID=13397 RepID=UPI001B7E76A6|nr:taste receptor type 1 member 1-like [Carcharodon carcharias]